MKGAKGEARVRVPESRLGMASTSQRKSIPYGRYSALSACRAFLVALLAILPLCSAYATTYAYDAAGRLKSATNSQGQTATYDYDSRGNLIRIGRTESTQLAITSFTPNNGPPGIQVTINGSGFASSTSDNTVAFNGVSAPVLYASPNQLLVQVPQNATTGPLAVTVVGATVTSDDIFTVSTIGDPPVIASFAPTAGTPGTTVTLTGQHLNPIQGETNLTIDGIYVPIASISDLGISFQLPPWVGSGPITVTTPYGVAVTASPFLAVPAGTDPGSFTSEPLLIAGAAPQSVVLTAISPNAAFLFKAGTGDYLSLQASSFSSSTNTSNYSVISPLGTVVSSGNISASSPSIHLPPMLEAGTYSVFLGGGSSAPQFSLALEQDQEIIIDGASLALGTAVPNSTKRIIFKGTALGANLSLGISNLVTNNASSAVSLNFSLPDGAPMWEVIEYVVCDAPQCSRTLTGTTQLGTYSLTVGSLGSSGTFSLTATLSNTLTASLPATNTPTTMNLSRFGQNGIYSFNGTAGQKVALQFIVPNGSNSILIQVNNPDGSTLVSQAAVFGASTYNLTLSQTGTYIAYVWLGNGGVPSSVTATLAVDAPATLITTTGDSSAISSQLGGQNEYATFNATAGENIGLGISNLVVNNGTLGLWIYIYAPDGRSLWQQGGCDTPQCNFVLFNAPVTGTYTVLLSARSSIETFSATVTVSDAATSTLLPGVPQTINMSRFGQTGLYTFSGAAGQGIALQFVVSSGGSEGIEVLNPDGSDLVGGDWVPDGKVYNRSLTQTGTYSVRVWLANGSPGSMTATLAVDAAPVSVTAGGSSATVSNQLNGQNETFTFNATAGENIGLGISNLVISNDVNGIGVFIYPPNSTSWWQQQGCAVPQCSFSLFNMPVTGTYTVVFVPQSSQTFSATVTVSDALALSLPTTTTPTVMNLPRAGQTGIYTFSGTAGQGIALEFTVPSGHAPVGIEVRNPDGSSDLIGGDWVNDGKLYNRTFTQTGTYTIYVWLYNGVPSSVTATLAVDAPPVSVTTGGSSATVSNQLNGQNETFTFNATAGENIGLGISNLVTNDGNGIGVFIYPPNSTSWWQQQGCAVPQCSFSLFNMPVTGTYTVVFTPQASQTFSATVTATDAATAVLSPGTPQTLTLSSFGQTGIYAFSGYTGQKVTLQFSVPSGSSNFAVQGLNPDSTTLFGADWVNGSRSYTEVLPQTGTYTVRLYPANGGVPFSAIGTLTMTNPGTLIFDPNNTASLFTLANSYQTIALSSSVSGGGYVSAYGNCGVSFGKWIYRAHIDSENQNLGVGIALSGTSAASAFGQNSTGYAATADGYKVNGGNAIATNSTYGANSVVDVAYDATNGNVWIASNGTWIGGGDPASGTSPLYSGIPAGIYLPAVDASQSGDGFTIQVPPTVSGFTAWPGTCTSTAFTDVIGHAVTVNGGAEISNFNYKFGSPLSVATDSSFAAVELLLHFEQPTASTSSGVFNGSSDWLTVADSSDFDLGSSDFTWEAWVYPSSLSGSAGIFGKRANNTIYAPFEFLLSGGGVWALMSSNGTSWPVNLSGGSGMTVNAWHHVMASRVAGTLYIGFDGNVVASGNANFAVTTNTTSVSIGAAGADGDFPFSGYIDEVRFTKGVGRYSGTSYAVPTAAFAQH